jgi:hypothetical protein
MGAIHRGAWAAAVLAAGLVAAGCGLPGAPLPPSLNLPQRVTDLSAVRAGDRVALHWTMPVRTTDKLLLEGNISVRVCRRESATAACATAATLQLAPGAAAECSEALPAPLASGSPRALTYFVELDNSNGRSAGLSNGATVLAGEAPPAITGLNAEMAKNGVVLRWNAVPPAQEPGPAAVRLERKLVSLSHAKPAKDFLAPPPEPAVQRLLVPAGSTPGVALDKDVRFGETYEYRAQRVLRVNVDGSALELPGTFSPPVRIHAVNAFPPAVPTGLAAVATSAQGNFPASIDLSWQPVPENDVAGYVVYRRQDEQPWQRISPPQPVVGPGFHDAHVEPGHTYFYAVSAVGTDGLESARSTEAQETVPNQ